MNTESRSYHSPLRQQQAQATRQMILEAVGHVMGDAGHEELSSAWVARAAGVREWRFGCFRLKDKSEAVFYHG